jgi:hypothetical protein
MNSSKNESYEQAFIIKGENLKNIDALFNTFPGDSKYRIETKDKYENEYEDVKEVLNLENSSLNPIQRITISSYSLRPSSSIRLSFEKNTYANIRCSVDAEKTKARSYFNSLEGKIINTKPWYSRLAKADFITYSISLFVAFIILVLILAALNFFGESTRELNDQEDAMIRLLGFLIIGSVFGIGWGLNKIRSKIFPDGSFALNQGLKKYELLEKVRWTVFVGGSITMAISLFFLLFGKL